VVGLGLAPWNICKYPFTQTETGLCFPDGRPVVFYHFHALKFCTGRIAWLMGFKVRLDRNALELLYRPYIGELVAIEALLAQSGRAARIPRVGIPWRYLAGRVLQRQPVRHFMVAPKL